MLEFPDLKFDIVYNLESFPLVFAPIGWDKIDVSEEINKVFACTWPKVKADLKFVYDGASILRQIMFSEGADATALFRIYKRDPYILGKYNLAISQQIDFQEYSDIDGVVSVGLKNRGMTQDLENFIDVQYSILVDGNPKAVDMNIGGIGVGESATFISAEAYGGIGGYNAMFPSLSISTSNIVGEDILELNDGYSPAFVWLGDLSIFSYNWFMKVTAPMPFTMKVKGNLKGAGAGIRSGQKLIVLIQDETGVNQELGYGYYNPQLGQSPLIIDFNANINLVPGRKYSFALHSERRNDSESYGRYALGIQSLVLDIDYSTYTLDYTVKGLRLKDLLYEIMSKINPDRAFELSAPVLESGLGHNIVIASGDCIRGIPGATIQTSLKEWLDSAIPQLNGAFKPIEDLKYKFDKVSDIQFNSYAFCGHIGTVKSSNYQAISEAYIGGYKVGYNDNTYDKTNGRDETNTEVDRSVVGSKSTLTENIKSTYRADPRGVDQLILDYRVDKTRDNSGDKQNFQFVIQNDVNEEDGLYHLVGTENYKSVEGTSALGRIYNLDLAPVMMFYRNSSKVAVQFAIKKEGTVKFESSKKNANLKLIKFDDSIIAEKDSISYADMLLPLYLPIKCTMTCVIDDELYESVFKEIIRTGGYFTYEDFGIKIKAFPVSFSRNLTGDNVKEIICYLHRDNDLNALVKAMNQYV